MRFNNGLERKRFENNWEKLHIEYRQDGMDEEAIEAMYEFDLEQYRGQRNYCFHNQYMSTDSDQSDYERDDDRSPLIKKFQDRFQLDKKPIVVADRGMLNNENIAYLENTNYKYILAYKIKNISNDLKRLGQLSLFS